MTKRVVAWILSLTIAAAVAGGLIWVLSRPKEPEIKYETASVERGTVSAHVTASGTLSALVTVQVGSQVSGRIEKLFADFNSQVKKDQIIAKIEQSSFEADVRKAKANVMAAAGTVAKAKAEALNAERQFARTKELRTAGLASQSELEAAESSMLSAKAQVDVAGGSLEQARAAAHQADINIQYTTIKSPIDGIVISRSVDVGQTVAASLSAPTLFTIAEDLRKMQVDTFVAEADVGKLKPGMVANFTVDAFPGRRFKGTVREIRNAAQNVQNVITYDAVIDVDNSALELKPGMTANVTVVVADRTDVLRVPNAALRFRPAADGGAPNASGPGTGGGRRGRPAGSGPAAWASAAASADAPPGDGEPAEPRGDPKTVFVLRGGKPEPVRLRVGITDGSFTEVVDGQLQEGDPVITTSAGGASPGGTNTPGGGRPGGQNLRKVF